MSRMLGTGWTGMGDPEQWPKTRRIRPSKEQERIPVSIARYRNLRNFAGEPHVLQRFSDLASRVVRRVFCVGYVFF